MRALLALVLAATGLWTGYWWVGASSVEAAVNQWFAAQPVGMASNSGVAVQGIPNRFDLTVTAPVLADPAAGITWTAPFVQVYAMTWKPWHVIAALPSGQVITLPDQSVTVVSDKIIGSLMLHPGSSLAMDETIVDAQGLALTSDAGWTVGVAKALASSREDATRAFSYRMGLQVADITPDPDLMQALATTDLPPQIAQIHLDAYATLTAALDRFAAETKPKLSVFELTEARINWGAVKFTASGKLTAATTGFAEGDVTLRVEGWRLLPTILVAMGAVKPDIAPTVERMMEVMAQQGGDLEVLTMVLKCRDGAMTLGPLPLGPAPRFF